MASKPQFPQFRRAQLNRMIESARKAVAGAITATAAHSRYAAALSSEGYEGGYRDALDDILLLLNGGGAIPNRRNFWQEAKRNG